MAVPHWLRVQLSNPHGILARPMAHLLNRINRDDYTQALAALGWSQGETILELGFGGGLGVDTLLAHGVNVIASEPSEEMRARAYRRWSHALAKGTLEVWSHTAESLPNHRVDRAISMNTVYFWQDIEAGFANLRRMVGTRVVLGIASPKHLSNVGFQEEGFRVEEVDWYLKRLESVGFRCTIEPPKNGDGCALLIGESQH